MLAESIIAIFIMIISFGMLYLGFKRNAAMWGIMATVFFAVNTMFTFTIPFQTTTSGVIPTGANFALSGMHLLFAFFGLLLSTKWAFEFLGKS